MFFRYLFFLILFLLGAYHINGICDAQVDYIGSTNIVEKNKH